MASSGTSTTIAPAMVLPSDFTTPSMLPSAADMVIASFACPEPANCTRSPATRAPIALTLLIEKEPILGTVTSYHPGDTDGIAKVPSADTCADTPSLVSRFESDSCACWGLGAPSNTTTPVAAGNAAVLAKFIS